jgi:XTP/dITP diphosphohydrolase
MKIYFVTSNDGKFREASEIVGKRIVKRPLDIEEIQSVEVGKVVLHKLDEAYRKVGKPVIVEDTGLYLEALKGFPGALIKHMEDSMGIKGILKLLSYYKNDDAVAETAIGFNDGKNSLLFVSVTKGKITKKERGKNGFGFDQIFVPEGSRKTLAEMDVHEKNLFSARGKSFRKLEVYLIKNRF